MPNLGIGADLEFRRRSAQKSAPKSKGVPDELSVENVAQQFRVLHVQCFRNSKRPGVADFDFVCQHDGVTNELGQATDRAIVTFVVTNPRRIDSRKLFALVDVEMKIASVSFVIHGVQARKVSEGTSVHLPTYKDRDGVWRPAVGLPEELREALIAAVLEFLVTSGLARPRFAGDLGGTG
jgi:DNA-binding cell septation regulator SpoVG